MLSPKASPTDTSLVEYFIDYLLENGKITEEELHTFHPSVCNRLDRNTSGIVAAGKTLQALQGLSEMFRDRTLKKYYLCPVKGQVKENQRIHGYLVKNEKTNKVTVSQKKPAEQTKDGKEASAIHTEYKVLARNRETTLLEVHLITGKTHRIRAHPASIGHPIAGDYKYGNRSFNDALKRNTDFVPSFCMLTVRNSRRTAREISNSFQERSSKHLSRPYLNKSVKRRE